MTHTPGPWSVEYGVEYGETDRALNIRCEPNDEDSGTFICEMQSSIGPAQTASNARLIAAAPELLAALDELTSRVDMVLYAKYVGHDRIAKARAAIAKAQG